MIVGALADPHGNIEAVEQAMRAQPGVDIWLCVGDLGDDVGRYDAPPAPLFWIKGNNEDFDFVCAQPPGGGTLRNLHYIPNGTVAVAGPLRIAGLGGTFAPTWYGTPAATLPHPGPRAPGAPRSASAIAADKRRHFVEEEVLACKAFRDVDVFLSHEAPRPFFVPFRGQKGGAGAKGMDAGKQPINDILAAMKPRLHLFGHHHRFDDRTREGVRSVCLDPVSRSYLLIDTVDMAVEKIDV